LSKQSRKLSRGQAFTKHLTVLQGQAVNGFDPTKCKLSDIESVTLNIHDNSMRVTLNVPVGQYEGYADYEEEFDLDVLKLGYVEDGARRLALAALRAIQERAMTKRPMPCDTCTAPCCGRELDDLRLTRDDLERLAEAGIDLAGKVKMLEAETIGGSVATIALKDRADGEQECVFLNAEHRCSIYEHRPRVCIEYSPWSCDIAELDEALAALNESDDEDDETSGLP
jgi:Fe-S-cluster containining protein